MFPSCPAPGSYKPEPAAQVNRDVPEGQAAGHAAARSITVVQLFLRELRDFEALDLVATPFAAPALVASGTSISLPDVTS